MKNHIWQVTWRLRRTLRAVADWFRDLIFNAPPAPDYPPCPYRHAGEHRSGYYVVQQGSQFVVVTCAESVDGIVTRIYPVVVSARYGSWGDARRVAEAWNQTNTGAVSDA